MPLCPFRSLSARGMAAAFALVWAGCSSSEDVARVAVHGKVSLNESPVKAGSISFLPGQGNSGPVANGRIEHGEYSFGRSNGPAPGDYRVLVTPAASETGKGKAENIGSKRPRNHEWTLSVTLPEATEFEHNIDLKE